MPEELIETLTELNFEPYCPSECKLQDDGTYIVAPGHRYSYWLTVKAAQQECDRLNANVRIPQPPKSPLFR